MLHDGDPRSTSMVSWKQRMKAGCMWCYSTAVGRQNIVYNIYRGSSYLVLTTQHCKFGSQTPNSYYCGI